MRMTDDLNHKAKFVGSMVGSALGDAIGELAFHIPDEDRLHAELAGISAGA